MDLREPPPGSDGRVVLFREIPAGSVHGLASAGDVAGVPGIARSGVALPLAGFDQAGNKLGESVGLRAEVPAGLGQRGAPFDRPVQVGAW